METTTEQLELNSYDKVIVAFSGGKDSVACALQMLDLGVPREKLELWHHKVDGAEEGLMDWPVTSAYCKAVARHLGVPLLFQWREGGFEAEMLREGSPTGDVLYEKPDGSLVRLPSQKHRVGTRLKFPQVSANLSVRWCSAYLKIDVCARVMNNDARFAAGRFLLVSGERAEESAARAKYEVLEDHRSCSQRRVVHQWRPIKEWSEQQVWDKMKEHKLLPHPAYLLGFGRVSCMMCIFGNPDQWASVQVLAPDRFEQIARYEERFGLTIHRTKSVRELAASGSALMPAGSEEMQQLSQDGSPDWGSLSVLQEDWSLPAGAFRRCGGPT